MLGLGLVVAVPHEEHRHEAERNEYGGVWEQHRVAYMPHQRARDDRGHDLRDHREGVVVAGESADIRAAAHLDDHRQRVYVYRRPRKADECKHDEHDKIYAAVGRGQEVAQREADRQEYDAGHDRALSADLGGDDADGYVADDRAASRYQQAGRCAAQRLTHDLTDVGREPCFHRVVADKPQADRRQQENEALLHGLGQGLVAAAVVLG